MREAKGYSQNAHSASIKKMTNYRSCYAERGSGLRKPINRV